MKIDNYTQLPEYISSKKVWDDIFNNDTLTYDTFDEYFLHNIPTEISLLHRMKMIVDDAQVIIDHLESGKSLTDTTKCSDSIYVHLSNIEIAVDLKSKESLTWRKFTR